MKKLLVTGYMRTGTTFLANFLNSQEECLIYRDFLRSIFLTSNQLGIKSFLTELDERQKNVLLSQLKAESWSFGSKMMDSLNKDFFNLRELYNNALELMKGEYDYKIVGSKITGIGNWLPTLLEETDICVIYTYRDIRDVLLSAKNMFAKYNPVNFMITLENDIETVFKIQDNKNLFMLRFEDFILNTDLVIKNLSEFLDVQITKEIDTMKDRETNGWINNSAFHDLNKMFDKRACYRWKNYRDSDEVKYCEILLPSLIKKLGYHIDIHNYRILDKVLVYKDFYNQKFKNSFNRIIQNLYKL